MNRGGWRNLCQSGKGQDSQRKHSSSWWHSECPSLWQNESWKGDKTQRDPVRSLLALIPIFLSTWVKYRVTYCKTRFRLRLEAQTRPTLECIQIEVMAVKVPYPLTRLRWPEFFWLVRCRHYRNKQACGWWYSCGLPWQLLHGSALPGVSALAWPVLEHMHKRRSWHTGWGAKVRLRESARCSFDAFPHETVPLNQEGRHASRYRSHTSGNSAELHLLYQDINVYWGKRFENLLSQTQPGCCNKREEQKTHKAKEFLPLISVIIWTRGLGGLLPAPFFAEIYSQTNVMSRLLQFRRW